MKKDDLTLSARHHWVFDLDGTLTQNIHDFMAVRQVLDIPANSDILGYLATLPEQEAKHKYDWLINYERRMAEAATPAKGAIALVNHLKSQGCQLAILTRNDKALAQLTLAAIGLTHVFDEMVILGRDQALPKPDADGLLKIARQWGVSPTTLLMVGDYYYDMACGRNAHSYTLLVNQPSNLYPELVDWFFPDCQAVLTHLTLS